MMDLRVQFCLKEVETVELTAYDPGSDPILYKNS